MPQGNLSAAVEAGFPQSLVIPLAPINAPFEKSLLGKIPAYYGYNGWIPKKDWQSGVSYDDFYNSDVKGCNAGLILGVPCDGFNFIALDVDTNPHDTDAESEQTQQAWRICGIIVASIVRFFRDRQQQAPVWVRMTRPGRVSMLFNLPPDQPAGKKGWAYLLGKNGEDFGKIEILSTGQQTVIGGTHAYNNGTNIVWRDAIGRSGPFRFARLNDGIAAFESRADFDKMVRSVLQMLHESLEIAVTDRKAYYTQDDSPPLKPEEQAPIGVPQFLSLFEKLPHDEKINRDAYIKVMLSASACIRAARSVLRISEEDAQNMEDAAVAWAAKWDDPKGVGTTEEQERLAWQRDFSLRHVNALGWRYLLGLASELGNREVQFWSAQEAFPSVPAPQGAEAHTHSTAYSPPVQQGPVSADEGVPTPRKGQALRFDVKSSDVQIADYIQNKIGESMAWVPELKTWIVWSGVKHGGWSTENPNSVARTRIEDQLVFYVDQNASVFGNSEGTKVKLTSEARVTAIEKLLRARLAVSSSKLNATKNAIQTPQGMFDLATGRAFGWQEQRAAYEQRSTSVVPLPGDTPVFDSVLEHLACGDKEIVRWLWAFMGYVAVGNPVEHLMLVITGPGENGKSKFANVLRRVLGDYARQIDRRVLTQSGKGDHPTGLYDVKGKRLWCVSEFQDNEQWNEAQIKALTGGDPINARGMHQDMKEINAEGVFLIYTNYVPSFEKISNALIRRFRILNARIPVAPENKDLNIENKIMDGEASAILFKILVQAKIILANKGMMPPAPQAMVNETKQYFQAQDMFHSWFVAQCEVVREDKEDIIDVDDLYKRYLTFVARNKGSTNEFGLPDEDMETDTLGVMGFCGGLKRSGAVVESRTVTTKTVNGKGVDEKKKIVRGIRLKVKAL